MGQVTHEMVLNSLLELLEEVYDGPKNAGGTWLVSNQEKSGILGSIDSLTAEQASRPPIPGAPTIAAHVEHLRFSLDLANRAYQGEDAYSTAKWSESWKIQSVSPVEWEKLRAELRHQFEKLASLLPKWNDWEHYTLTGGLASVAHAAYHLGAIRLALHALRGTQTESQSPHQLITTTLLSIFKEAIEGPEGEYGLFLEGGMGLLPSLKRISAKTASAPLVEGRPSITNFARHLLESARYANSVVHGEPFEPNWGQAWEYTKLTEPGWSQLQLQLEHELRRIRQATEDTREWNKPALDNALATLVHLALHIGGIHDIERTHETMRLAKTRGPKAQSRELKASGPKTKKTNASHAKAKKAQLPARKPVGKKTKTGSPGTSRAKPKSRR